MPSFFRTTFVLVALASTVLSMPQPLPSATHISKSSSTLHTTHVATPSSKTAPKVAFVAASSTSKTSSKVGFGSPKATSSPKPKAATPEPIIPPLIIPTTDQDGPDAHTLTVSRTVKRTVEILRNLKTSLVGGSLKGRDFLGLRSDSGNAPMTLRGESKASASRSSLSSLAIPVARAHVLKAEMSAEDAQQVK